MEYFSLFISENASFFSTYGNWVLIPLFLGVIFIDNRLPKRASSNKWIKALIKTGFIVSAFVLGGLIYMINFPLKPMVQSIAKVERNIGQQIHNFDFLDVRADRRYNISDFEGKLVILNFWGTYCGPCIEEFPDLKKIESDYSNEVTVIALSDEDTDRIMNFVQRIESPTIVGRFLSDKWIDLESFRPLTIIIDQNSIVKEYVFGKKDYGFFKSVIEEYL